MAVSRTEGREQQPSRCRTMLGQPLHTHPRHRDSCDTKMIVASSLSSRAQLAAPARGPARASRSSVRVNALFGFG